MGLDIYAWTLTRYYAGNWKSAVEQWADANGYSFSRITPEGDRIEEETLEPAEVQEAIEQWRDWLLETLASEEQSYSPWPENNTADYYTDKPDWPAWGALLLYSACLKYGQTCPEQVAKNWDFAAEPLVQRALADEQFKWSLFSGVTIWLPLEGAFWFQGPGPAGDDCIMATLDALRAELAYINARGWQAEEAEIISWSEAEGYPVEGEAAGQAVQSVSEVSVYQTQSLAKFAYAMLYQALIFAEAQRCAIILDY